MSVFIAVASSSIVSVIDYQISLSSLNFMANKATVSLTVILYNKLILIYCRIFNTVRTYEIIVVGTTF